MHPDLPRRPALAPAALPRLVYRQRHQIMIGAGVLAFTTAFANGAVLRLVGYQIGYLSGLSARVAADPLRGQYHDFVTAGLIILSFIVGATIAGAITGTFRVLPGRRYAVVLWLEGLAFLAAVLPLTMDLGDPRALMLPALACGLQNGMANGFYGVVIRTTHISGVLTDLGVMIGHWLRRHDFPRWRFALLGCIVAGFIVGGALGTIAGGMWHARALLFPGVGCLVAGALYYVWIGRHRADWPFERLDDERRRWVRQERRAAAA